MNSLCCPVLIPQMTGEPLFPGALTTNESVTQSPMAPPGVKNKNLVQHLLIQLEVTPVVNVI